MFGMLWFTPWRLFTDDPVNEAVPGSAPAAVDQPAEAASETGRAMTARLPRGRTTAAALRIQRSNSSSSMTWACFFKGSGVVRSRARLKGGFMTAKSKESPPIE